MPPLPTAAVLRTHTNPLRTLRLAPMPLLRTLVQPRKSTTPRNRGRTVTNFWLKRQYAEVSTDPAGLSERGYVYLLSDFFTIADAATIYFGVYTNSAEVEIQFYDLGSSIHPIKASLIEAPTVTKTASPLVGRNLNRTGSDSHDATFWTASSYTGGTVVATELVVAGGKTGGTAASDRIHTLAADTDYLMKFENLGNQPTVLHMNFAWSEGEPTAKELWTS